jgi:branched-chain amino acid transport system substrate-binding protein
MKNIKSTTATTATALLMAATFTTTAFTPVASAQQPAVKIAGIMELSGSGATPGTNFNNGAKLAVKEINAAGGILGRQLDYLPVDTQTNPAVAKALVQKAVDDGVYVVLGPPSLS